MVKQPEKDETHGKIFEVTGQQVRIFSWSLWSSFGICMVKPPGELLAKEGSIQKGDLGNSKALRFLLGLLLYGQLGEREGTGS